MGGKVLEYEAKTILRDGIQKGRLEGINEGKIKGKIEGKIEAYVSLVKDGVLTVEDAAKRLDMKKEDFEKYL